MPQLLPNTKLCPWLAGLLLLLSPLGRAWGQSMANYTTARTTGNLYVALSTYNSFGWRNGSSTDDNLSTPTNIGFTFVYDGVPYMQFSASTNGFLTFNTATSAIGSSNGAYGYDNTRFSMAGGSVATLAPLYYDLNAISLTTGVSYYNTVTTPGSRVLAVEWYQMQVAGSTSPSLTFQVRLYEADGHIEYQYGPMTAGTASYAYSLGINGASGGATASQLLTQQTANSNSFGSAASYALATIPTTRPLPSCRPR